MIVENGVSIYINYNKKEAQLFIKKIFFMDNNSRKLNGVYIYKLLVV